MKRYLTLLLTLILIGSSFSIIKADDSDYLISSNALFYYSKHILVMDMDTGDVIFERNGYEKVAPASITKVATLITSLELMQEKGIKLTDTFTFTQDVFAGMNTNASVAGFLLGETVTIEDLIYGIMMPSGADATRAMSIILTGNPESLATKMTELVKRIGMKATSFSNTSGLDDKDLYSTPYELARILQYAMQNEQFVHYYTALSYTTSPTRQHPNGISLTNYSLATGKSLSNGLMIGAKSGHTINAERALSSVGKFSGMNVIMISTNAPQEEIQNTNITDHVQTYKYLANNYKKETLVTANQVFETVAVKKGVSKLDVIATRDISLLFNKDFDIETLTIAALVDESKLIAPLQKGTKIGTLEVRDGDKLLYTEDLFANESIDLTLGQKVIQWVLKSLKIIFVILVILILILFGIRNYRLYKIRKRRKNRNYVPKKR